MADISVLGQDPPEPPSAPAFSLPNMIAKTAKTAADQQAATASNAATALPPDPYAAARQAAAIGKPPPEASEDTLHRLEVMRHMGMMGALSPFPNIQDMGKTMYDQAMKDIGNGFTFENGQVTSIPGFFKQKAYENLATQQFMYPEGDKVVFAPGMLDNYTAKFYADHGANVNKDGSVSVPQDRLTALNRIAKSTALGNNLMDENGRISPTVLNSFLQEWHAKNPATKLTLYEPTNGNPLTLDPVSQAPTIQALMDHGWSTAKSPSAIEEAARRTRQGESVGAIGAPSQNQPQAPGAPTPADTITYGNAAKNNPNPELWVNPKTLDTNYIALGSNPQQAKEAATNGFVQYDKLSGADKALFDMDSEAIKNNGSVIGSLIDSKQTVAQLLALTSDPYFKTGKLEDASANLRGWISSLVPGWDSDKLDLQQAFQQAVSKSLGPLREQMGVQRVAGPEISLLRTAGAGGIGTQPGAIRGNLFAIDQAIDQAHSRLQNQLNGLISQPGQARSHVLQSDQNFYNTNKDYMQRPDVVAAQRNAIHDNQIQIPSGMKKPELQAWFDSYNKYWTPETRTAIQQIIAGSK